MTTNCGACLHYNKHSVKYQCNRERRGERCEWERKPNWDIFTHKPMTSEEKREVMTKLLGHDPGPQYGDSTGYEEARKKWDRLYEEDEDHGDL